MSKPAVLLLLLAFALPNTAAAQGKKSEGCAVRGRAVDDAGAPVPKAYVLVDAGPPAGWEDLIIYEQADERGYFSYKLDYCPFPARSMTLYVTSPTSSDGFAPFGPPFLRSGRAGRAFAGQKVRGERKGDVDLGDVRVQVFYTAVTLKLVGGGGRPLLAGDDWGDVRVRLKTARGVWVSEQMLSANNVEKSVRAAESAVVMELPEGDWQFELRLTRKGGSWLKADRLVNVRRGGPPFTLTLRMAKGNRPKGS
jgi:hypothetical protein